MKCDVRMEVLFCNRHKEYFEDTVKVPLKKGIGIRPGELVDILKEAENCIECIWSTSFDEES